MPGYKPYLLPLIEGVPDQPEPAQLDSPLDEEIWLASHASEPLCWNGIAERVRAVYGIELLCHDSDIDISHCELGVDSAQGPFRYFTSSGPLAGFAMEHPSQLAEYDRRCEPHQRALLIRPSLFAKLISMLLADGVAPERSNSRNHDSALAFQNALRKMIRQRPSDWHLEARISGYEMRFRCNGRLGSTELVSRNKASWYVNSLKQACGMHGSVENKPLDGSFKLRDRSGEEVALRVSLVPSIHGLSGVVRFLYDDEQSLGSLASLGMNRHQQEQISKRLSGHEGMMLVCGPTGSGKTTTLHALLRMLVRQNSKVLSVEDPVERILPGVQQVQVDGGNGSGFATALKAFMRQAPDTILIGEIRDPDTAETAIQSAFSGHRILATLHARNTQGVFCRLTDFGMQPEMLGQVLELVIHQRLISLLCNRCRLTTQPLHGLLELIQREAGVELQSLHAAPGCEHCQDGYAGRRALFKIKDIRNTIRPDSGFQKQTIHLLSQGKIDLLTAAPYQNFMLRDAFSFHSCKDFANYSAKLTPG